MPQLPQPFFTSSAPAKINLGLRVGPKRADGYHNIQTTFAKITLADTLEFFPRSDQQLKIATLNYKLPEQTNLVAQAAHLLQELTQPACGLTIRLHKKIPLQAGLGGGSSDAAATLLALNKIWQLKLTLSQLQPLAQKLGADVPQFLYPGVLTATGLGEILHPTTLAPKFPRIVVIVVPAKRISTKIAFQKLSAEPKQQPQAPSQNKTMLGQSLENDFEPLIAHLVPEIQLIKSVFSKFGAAAASLSGSGSSVFGLFHSPAAACKVLPKMQKYGQVFLTRILI